MYPEATDLQDAMIPPKAVPAPWLRPELVSSAWEIAAVLTLTLGYYAYCSTRLAFDRWEGQIPKLRPTNYNDFHLMAGESAILALLLLFLNWRGWTSIDLKIRPGCWSSLQSLPLLIADLAVFIVGIFSLYQWNIYHPALFLNRSYPHAHITHVSWIVLISYQVMNAYFEELICMSYAFNQFAAKYGPLVALGLMLFCVLPITRGRAPCFCAQR